MGLCYGKTLPTTENDGTTSPTNTMTVVISANQNQTPLPPSTPSNGSVPVKNTPGRSSHPSPWPSPYPHGVSASPLPAGVSPSPARASTPRRFFRRPFPPSSPAKHIKASLVKRFGGGKPKESTIPEEHGVEPEQSLDKSFGYGKNFGAKYELGKEVGRGHFGHTCAATGKKGELNDQQVAVKIISKAKCPMQPGSFECGYYVMKYMQQIVTNVNILKDNFKGINEYTLEDITQLRDDWAIYVAHIITQYNEENTNDNDNIAIVR